MSKLDAQILEGAGLGVRFDFRGDRYGHEISLAEGPDWLAALTSVEDSAAAEWPPSPPLQTLHFETSDVHGRVALLVGMAGRSHWSASVKIDRAQGRMHFDIACRTAGAPTNLLGSQYQTTLPLVVYDGRQARLSLPGQSTRFLQLGFDDRSRECRLQATSAGLVALVASSKPLAQNQTVRWGYWVAVSNSLRP